MEYAPYIACVRAGKQTGKIQIKSILLYLLLCLPSTNSLFATPAPAVVVNVDNPVALGKPDQWPVIEATQQITIPKGESAQWTAGYDSQNLYLMVRVKDDSPLKNSTSPFDPAMMLKGGDAVGFCFGPEGGQGESQRIMVAQLDGKPMAVVYRPNSRVKKPYTFASPVSTYVMNYVSPISDVKAAFTPIKDGYAVGVAIPWSVLGYQPTDGLEFPFDAQVIFSDPPGTKNIATAWWRSLGNSPVCTVDLPTEAQIYPDLWGKARLYTKDPGPQETEAKPISNNVELTDPEGLEPVSISFKLPRGCKVSMVITNDKGWIVAEPLRAKKMSAGTHVVKWNGRGYRGMPLPSGTYHWRLGYFDGVRSRFYGAAGNSGSPPYPTSDNKGSVGGVHGGPVAVAADAEGVYLMHMGEEGEHGFRKITTDGKDVLWTHSLGGYGTGKAVAVSGDRVYMIAGHPGLSLTCMDAKTGRDRKMGTGSARLKISDENSTNYALAIVENIAYISDQAGHRIRTVDLTTGRYAEDIPLPNPGRLVKQDNQHLLVISGEDVVRIDLATKKGTPFLSKLIAPSAITIDAEKNVYVAELGDRQQITQFSPVGKRLKAFGKKGGRALAVPKYDPMEFRGIGDLTVDSEGHLWFAEVHEDLRRMGCLTTNGKWVRGYYGPVYCSSGMIVNLDDMSAPYYHIKGSYMKTRLTFAVDHDWRNADWKIESIHYMSQSGKDKPVTPDLFLDTAKRSFSAGITFTGRTGKKYLWIDGEKTYTRSRPGLLWLWENNHWVPIGTQGQNIFPDDDKRSQCWTDRNADGLVQEEEFYPSSGSSWRWLDRDLTLYGLHGSWRPASIDHRGVPDYLGGLYTPYAPDGLPAFLQPLIDGASVSKPAADGSVYYLINTGNGLGKAFWDRAAESKLLKMKDGKIQWWVGHHDALNRTDGSLSFTYNICGVEDGVIVISDVANQYIAYTDDGLTLGWLLTDDNGRPKWSGESYVSAESFSGQFVKDPKTGKYLLFCGASESMQVREVLGLGADKITRMNGSFELKSSMPRSTPFKESISIPYASWDGISNGRFCGIDGKDWEWSMREYDALTIRDGMQVVADLRLRRDAGYLSCFADVMQPGEFNAHDKPVDAVGESDGVELILGENIRVWLTARVAKEGQNKDRLMGEAFFIHPGSKPIAASDLMRPMRNDGSLYGDIPTDALDASETFIPIPGATVAVNTRPDGQGYRLEAEIPLVLFPEIASLKDLVFKRWTNRGNHQIKKYTEKRYDVDGPFKFNAAVFRTLSTGEVKRFAWQEGVALGIANGAVSISWKQQPGATGYKLYRATKPDSTKASLVETFGQTGQSVDSPGVGTFYYWLTAIEPMGESQYIGPKSVSFGKTNDQPELRFDGPFVPGVMYPNLPDVHLFPGSSKLLNLNSAAPSLRAKVSPAGATVNIKKLGETSWGLAVALPATAIPGTTYTVTLSATGKGKPVPATMKVRATPVSLAGQLENTGGTLTIDTTAPIGKPAASLDWTGNGSLVHYEFGTRGYILFWYQNKPGSTGVIRPPFVDGFDSYDGFHYGQDGSNMQFDLRLADGTVREGKDKDGYVRFGSVNSNAGTPGKLATYPRCRPWKINVTDKKPHLLTVFSPGRGGTGAKERFILQSENKDIPPVSVEFDGSQVGAVIQFRFIGNVTLTVEQTVGGMRSSNPGANCAAIFLD